MSDDFLVEDGEPAAALDGVLATSTDRGNPGGDEVRDLLERTRRIAVVGMSRHPEKPSLRVPAYLLSKGYEVVPGSVDMVMIFRPSEQAGEFVREALARPERPAIWLSEGIRADADVAEARRKGVIAVQDLCAYKVHSAL
jgi:predicted CoA-binding protein